MSTRADNITQTQKIQDVFSDFLDDLTPHPITHDVGRVRNEQSINQSIRNLILTKIGERFFQPNIGSNVYNSLFEPNDAFMQEDLVYSIRNVINQNEPRAIIQNVTVNPVIDESRISINVVYSIINTPTQIQTLNLILRRVR
jgi:phage baseplate assembly protein W